jgi:signal transduction histidine kinase
LIGVAAWTNNLATLLVAVPIPMLLLLFPTGRPRSDRWRWAIGLWALGLASAIAWAAFRRGAVFGVPGSGDPPSIHIENPVAVHLPAVVEQTLLNIAVVGLVGSGLLGVVCLLLRFRSARGVERQQLRWISLVALLVLILFVSLLLADLAGGSADGGFEDLVWISMVVLLILGLPAAVAIAILKYRLYDVDVVIRKTIVYGALAGFITLAYVTIVVGLGSLFADDLALSIAATAVVALAFQPVRERASRFANRVVYGKRATPYEVLARFSERVGGTYATEDVLPRTARVIAEATGAERVEVWLRVGSGWRRSATWPGDSIEATTIPSQGDEVPAFEGVDRTLPVRHQGELHGAVLKPTSEPLTPGESKLLDDLAGQAGLVLSNARLTAELQARLEEISARAEELRASRQRIVATQDEERRRLERNIHDGAQQHLVALAVKLRLARGILEKDPEKGAATLRGIARQVDDAVETLGTLALGIYPPVLEDQGLAIAIEAQARLGSLPVVVDAGGTGRLPIDLEAAVYFVCLEALQNAAKYANASRVEVRLRQENGALRFEVGDDGAGFHAGSDGAGTGLAGMRDRLSVFGGTVKIESAPGRGTRVYGSVPLDRVEVPT